MKVKIKIIKSDNIVIEDEVEQEQLDLTFLQTTVDGYIELVTLDQNRIMVVNDEGALLNLPYNREASKIVGCHIFGDTIIVPKHCLE